jgi:hypothetical protein
MDVNVKGALDWSIWSQQYLCEQDIWEPAINMGLENVEVTILLAASRVSLTMHTIPEGV